MEYYYNTTEIHLINTAITIGKFDGLHIGHKKLIDAIRKEEKNGLKSVLFTFSSTDFRDGSILTEQERKEKAEQMGLDAMVVWPFDKATMGMGPEDFVTEILVKKLGAKAIVVGDDFRFGRGRSGDAELLMKLADSLEYRVTVMDKVQWQSDDVSSTRVRRELAEGQMEKVNVMLGQPYSISGTVQHGRKLGRTLGMPTINVVPEQCKLLPPFGVYSSMTEIDGRWYAGVTNIGIKPSVGAEPYPAAETYLFGLDQDLYGKKVQIALHHWQRREEKFAQLELLQAQMHQDIENARNYLKEKGLAD